MQKANGKSKFETASPHWESLVGIGLRAHHYPDLHRLDQRFVLEAISCNYAFHQGGPGLAHLDRLARRMPMVMHGVSLNIGGFDPLDISYIDELKSLCTRMGARIVSDHLCFTRSGSHNSFDLLPVPKTQRNLLRIAERIDVVQNQLGRPIALENISTYIAFQQDEYREISFLAELCRRTGCRALLDVNNAYVCSVNHQFDAWTDILSLRPEDIVQYHIAGHLADSDCLIDTHAEPICEPVWELLAKTVALFGHRFLIVERDDDAPLDLVLDERKRAIAIMSSVFGRKPSASQRGRRFLATGVDGHA